MFIYQLDGSTSSSTESMPETTGRLVGFQVFQVSLAYAFLPSNATF
jgi:hypothetical protein